MSRFERRAVGTDLVVKDTVTGRTIRYPGVLGTGRETREFRTVAHRAGEPRPMPAEVRGITDGPPLSVAEVVARGVGRMAADVAARSAEIRAERTSFARRVLGGAA